MTARWSKAAVPMTAAAGCWSMTALHMGSMGRTAAAAAAAVSAAAAARMSAPGGEDHVAAVEASHEVVP
jgi:hypothetical protein